MREWQIEEGIAETRAMLVIDGVAAAARLDWPGSLAAGEVANARLIARGTGSRRGTMRFTSGEQALIDDLPKDASEGAELRVIVTRPALAETGRLKLAQCRSSTAAPRPAPGLAEMLRGEGEDVRVVRRFDPDDWDAIIAEAADGVVAFAGGSLTLCPTPAMTLIDIDGTLPPRALALAAVPAVAEAIGRLDLAGSIGVDFPTLPDKSDRRAVDVALETALAHWPHEVTAMNGFGFVQMIARLSRPSLLARLAADRAGAAARQLLRHAEAVAEPGALLLTAHPAVRIALRPEWEGQLAARTGRQSRWQIDAGLALAGGFAQAVPL